MEWKSAIRLSLPREILFISITEKPEPMVLEGKTDILL